MTPEEIRERLSAGRHIADEDVRALLAEIDELRAEADKAQQITLDVMRERDEVRALLRESEAREAALVAGLREIAEWQPKVHRPVIVATGLRERLRALLREHEQRREQRQGGTTT